MKRGRWVALLLSGAMMISQCALAVDLGWQESGAASVQTQAGDSLPAVGEIIFEDDFSGSEIKANWVQEPSGAAVQTDGRMTLTCSTGNDIAKLWGYFKEDQTAIEGGVVGVSFDLYRTEETKAQRIQLQLRGISNSPFSVICWQNGRVYVQGSRTAGVTENKLIYDESIYTGDQLQVTYLFDLDNSTFQTWLDGEQVIEQGYPRTANLQSLTQMYLYLEDAASTEYSVQLDNMRVFKPAEEEPEPEETVYFEDDFSGSEIKANWVQEPSGAAVQADGRMTLTRSTGSDIAKLTGYFNADQSTITGGKVQVSFELYRPEETKSQRIQMQLRGTSNKPYAAMSWENDRVYIQGSRTAGVEENQILYDKSTYTGDQLQVTYLFDLDNSTFQTWLDGEQVIELGYPRTSNLSNLQHLYMFLEKPASTAYSVQLDNVRVFEPAEEEEPEPGPATIPQEGRMLLLDDFSGESMLSNWVQEPAGVAAQQDGRITLTHTEQTAGGVAKLTGYFNEDQSTITGKKIGISFDMYRTDASKKIQMQFRGEGGGKEPFTSIIWQNGTIQSHYVDTKGESGTSTAPTVGTTYTDDHVQVTYLFDLIEGSFSLWLNGELKLENKYPRTANLKNLQNVYLFLESTNYCSVQLDNFHVFEPAGNTLWQDSFDSAARDARWVTNDEGALVQEGGYLTLTRTDTTSGTATYVDGYFNEDQSSLKGKVGLSFGLRRERTDKRIQLHFKSGNSPFTTLLWETTGIINAHYSDTEGVGTDSKAKELEGDYSSNRIWVDYLFDMDDGSFTLWIDGELKVEQKYPRTANLTSLNYLHAYMENADTNTFSLYNWHVYTSSTETPGVPDDDAIAADLEALTQESLLKVPMLDSGLLVDSLDLPTKGENGSTITWESSSMDVIENDGTLTRPAEDLSVQLTATVSRGSASQQKIFDFTVAGQSRDINGMPQGGSIIVEDRFDDNQLDARIKATNGSGSVTEHDGKAYIVRSASGSENMLDYYFNTDQSALTGTIVTEFILNRATETRVNVRLRSSTNKDYTGIDWYGDYLGLHYSSQQGEDGKAEQPDEFYGAQTQLKVTIQVNTAEHSLSMWLNNQLAIDNMYTRIAAADDLRYVRIYLEGNNLTTATVDDFRTYRIISDDDAVAADLETLTQESLLKVPMLDSGLLVDSLDLPAKGQNGSAIAWESNPAGIIASDGTLTRPEEDTAVKLTATVSSGSVSQQKTFDFTVAGTNTDIAGMPQDGIPIVEDRFDDNKLDERIKVSNGSGSVTEHDGKAYIVRSSNGGSGSENMLDYYFNADRSGLTGTIVTEFILNRATATRVNVRLRSSAGREYTGVDWYSDYLAVYASEQKGEDGVAVRQDSFYGAQTQLKVTIKVNTAEQLVSVWLNNQLAIDNMYGRHANANDLQYVRIYLEGGGLTTATVDDFRVYRFLPDMPDEERVQTDIAELTYEKIIAPAEVLQGIIASDIKLPTIGTNGSTIVWTSSHPDLIAVDGTVTRPGSEYEVNPEVTLTATVSSGDYSQQIELKVKVLLEKINLDEEPGLSEIIYEDDFEDGAIDHHITATADNGTIVEEDGVLKVTRTSNDASSPTIADLYAMEDQSMVEGAIGVEYTLTREDNKVVPTRIRSSGSNDGLAVTWNANGAVALLYRTSATSGQVSTTTSQSFSDELHVKAVFYTENSQVSLWLNGQLILSKVYTRTQASTLQYVRIYLEATNYTTVNIDDFKIYYATMPAIDSLNFDVEWLTDSLLLTEPYVMENIIDSDLNLPTTGKYGSQITWESSDPSLIAEDGTVTRPLDVPDDPEVTLTATLTVGGLEVKKTFQFRVLRDFSDAGERLEAGLEALTVSSLTSEDPQQLKYSLALSDKSLYGDTLTWSSSNTAVITNSGRVIRPRSDQPAQQVTLTATMSNGSLSQQKQMTFTVVPDEEYVDPDYMSDEEFFGKWDGAKWVTEGKFDYSRDDMKEVEAAVKEGDYAKASEALLQHMRERDENLPLSLAAREPGWVDMVLDDIHHLQTSKYYQGNATITSTDYTRIVIPVQASAIAKGGTNTYSIIARYNEASSVLIASKETGSMGARLELTVNGQTKNYEVDADAVIRAGNYKTQNYGQETDMEATMFGDFLGDDTSRVLLRFQISDLLETDTVTEARLILYAKVTPAYAGNKSIVALYEPTNTWDENTVNWNTLTGYVYNFNGIPGANTGTPCPDATWNTPTRRRGSSHGALGRRNMPIPKMKNMPIK